MEANTEDIYEILDSSFEISPSKSWFLLELFIGVISLLLDLLGPSPRYLVVTMLIFLSFVQILSFRLRYLGLFLLGMPINICTILTIYFFIFIS